VCNLSYVEWCMDKDSCWSGIFKINLDLLHYTHLDPFWCHLLTDACLSEKIHEFVDLVCCMKMSLISWISCFVSFSDILVIIFIVANFVFFICFVELSWTKMWTECFLYRNRHCPLQQWGRFFGTFSPEYKHYPQVWAHQLLLLALNLCSFVRIV
jgi:hypothetical protein